MSDIITPDEYQDTMSEEQLQDSIIEHAQANGWRVFHARPARTKDGWRTPVAADGKGFPDIIAIHERTGQMIVAELKSATGKLSADQDAWLTAFARADVPAFIWTPREYDAALAVLRGENTT